MKKFFPYIIIFSLLTSILAPFSVGINENKQVRVEKNVAMAETYGLTTDADKSKMKQVSDECLNSALPGKDVCVTADYTQTTGKSISLIIYELEVDHTINDYSYPKVSIEDPDGKVINTLNALQMTQASVNDFQGLVYTKNNSVDYNGYVFYPINITLDMANYGSLPNYIFKITVTRAAGISDLITLPVTIQDPNAPDFNEYAPNSATPTIVTSSDVPYYECGAGNGIIGTLLTGGGTIAGCISQITYLFFKLSTWLFAGAGMFFDFTFGYSIQSDTYSSMTFITEGWRVVRDLMNLFFIFVLLYAAISIILDLNHGEGKKIIINVIIIGLLINFSLFATRMIVDASNILARVFYTQIVIENATDAMNDARAGIGTANSIDPRYKSLSAGLVDKINPQILISKASKIGDTTINENSDATSSSKTGSIGVGSFILVTLLAMTVCIIGAMVFLSVGLIFLARIIGLALAMILAPIAFFTYTVPKMRDIDTIGINKWFPETIKLAFVAPIFIFFIYLIIKFVQTGLGLGDLQSAEGIRLVLLIVIPFAFIIILLKRAGDIAKKMSGEMGQAITSGLKVVGGVALGATALGAAALGRGAVGGTMKMIQNDSARKNALKFTDTKQQWQKMNKLNPFSYLTLAGKAITGTGKAAIAGTAQLAHMIPAGKDATTGQRNTLGQKMQKADQAFGKKQTSLSTLNSKTVEKFGGKGKYDKEVTFKELTETEQLEVKKIVDKDQLARQQFGTSFDNIKEDTNRQVVNTQIENAYNTYNAAPKSTVEEERIAKEQLKTDSGITKDNANDLHKYSIANEAIGEFTTALRKGSYDVRNVSQLKSSNKGMAKMGVGLIAGVAAGVRMGLKQGVGIEHGKGQKDFFVDLGHTITEALKNMNVKVEGGGGHAPAVKNVGGGHGGGGGH